MIIKNIIKNIIVGFIPLLLVTSCGNDSTAPDDGSITIVMSPGITVADDPADPVPACIGFVHIEPVTITVRDARGNPLGNVDIEVHLSSAGNTAGFDVLLGGVFGLGVVDLWDDLDGNSGITDNLGFFQLNEHITGLANPQIFNTTTDPDGSRTLFLTADVSPDCEYGAVLRVTSGSVFGSEILEVGP